ncbi:hypothetical protein EJP72_00115 [Pseudomonas aeruginosa]|nr:hypothetical protein D8667_24275 [Pseudomonas aeruginosa]AYR10537.1 hypothetical protein D8668_00450 [Pseudomonas aeruginosa]AZN03112.1 hypothetical protein EJA96_28710 [Pseudomonas aeruginosa]AZN08838.1 hypothetical protein EJA98_27295 [Pseudomonas aeruginosa]AZN56005.1 hypothetical protein EJP72_00115 [Pseudomonas aeruginosa]
MFSCSIIEQKQLNTWVSFQSAEQPLLGQFSVSGNRRGRTTGPSTNSIEPLLHKNIDSSRKLDDIDFAIISVRAVRR